LLFAFNFLSIQSVQAQSTREDACTEEKLRDLGVAIINCNGTPTACSTDGHAGLDTEDNIAIIFNFFIDKGLEDFQAAGILGNMRHESGYEPMRAQGIFDRTVPGENWREAIGGGWGLVQWTPGSKIVDPVIAAGQNVNDIQVQLEFLWWQLTGEWPEDWGPEHNESLELPAGNHLRSTTNVADATYSFETRYERHAGPPQPSRIVEAERILDLSRSGEIAETSGNRCSSAGTGDVVGTALEYAWPEWRPRGTPNAREMKPEYAQAVSVAMDAGRYVGGIDYDGVDCGGFVTTVMIDSGYEPEYNHSGVVADGASSTATQLAWVRQNWELVGRGSDLTTADLQPGDVAFQVKTDGSNDGHTFMWVGDQPGFDYPIASASLDQRAPMAGAERPLASNIEWYRKI